ncbi:hypothetical protein BE221DRAFT_63891 [Ostreococcus tauri]|uniref:DUF1754-domain-containing protein n=1 Tax=Ostreococcus tauri TaxID=70448 RepID=A0A1Y5I0M0_OSTTA|nr:hypothetical protein BE221DRAFT_63891 [Ostreococcus tauri]
MSPKLPLPIFRPSLYLFPTLSSSPPFDALIVPHRLDDILPRLSRSRSRLATRASAGDGRGTGDVGDRRTEAEKAYEEAYRKQHEARLVRELASKSHKDKVREFNEKLSKMSEHHDLPKIGPG